MRPEIIFWSWKRKDFTGRKWIRKVELSGKRRRRNFSPRCKVRCESFILTNEVVRIRKRRLSLLVCERRRERECVLKERKGWARRARREKEKLKKGRGYKGRIAKSAFNKINI